MPTAAQHDLALGTLFTGRYRIERLLGEGAMGRVYRTLDEDLGEPVALKVLLVELTRDATAVERFRREVRLARRVTHPNVVRTHDLGHHEGVYYLTMEWVEGKPLDVLLRERGPLPLSTVLELGQQICAGLQAAHAVGVLHRDLKPSNILLAADARVAITDFGIARSLVGDEDGAQTVGVLGTPHYMAPEQVEAEALDARTDVYALGGILFELLTGRLPFAGKTPLAQAVARLRSAPLDPRSLVVLPEDVAALVERCLARQPDQRPGSAAEVSEALALRVRVSSSQDAATDGPRGVVDRPRRDAGARRGDPRSLVLGARAHHVARAVAGRAALSLSWPGRPRLPGRGPDR